MISEERMDQIVERFRGLESAMGSTTESEEIVRLAREYAEVEPVARCITHYRDLCAELRGVEEMLTDPELQEMAAQEADEIRAKLGNLERELRSQLAPVDRLDARPAILEIRAGVGGQEAGLFAGDLLAMYAQYAASRAWSFEIVTERATEVGGLREAVAIVRGRGVFARMKHEAGVHRVQRVPETESSGRIHTSAATVAVLPEPEEVEVRIPKEDLRIETMRASGAGGQHVNKTDSAVRITHIPTGIAVQSSEKSQHRNRARAMQVLKARLFEREREESESVRSDSRRGQIGSGDRSERIRTYNFPQARVTDHRIGLTLHNLPEILGGSLDPVIDALVNAEQAARLASTDG